MPITREAAVRRKRNVIFNNDGDDALHYGHTLSGPATKQGLLSLRMDHIGDTGIDTVYYCTTQNFNAFTHDSQVTEIFATTEGAFSGNRTAELIAQGIDPLQVAIECCRQHGIEVFWTHRLNDIHDTFWEEMISQWKKDHPGFLMGERADKDKYPFSDPRHVWTYVDYANDEVRDQVVVAFRDVLQRYDVDGIDLDFLRNPAYFRETRLGEPVTVEHRDMLTDMVARVRQEVLAESERRDKPILMSARVLPTIDLNTQFGFDVRRWIEHRDVDFISVAGGYDPFTMPLKNMVDLGHDWGIPVNACLSVSGFIGAVHGVEDAQVGNTIESWRAAAANAWHAGVDGIMTFNLFPSLPKTAETEFSRQVWRDIGDSEELTKKEKVYCIENLEELYNTGFMVRSVPIDGRLPIEVAKQSSVERTLPVADNVADDPQSTCRLCLRICVAELDADDVLTAHLNGSELDLKPEKPQWLSADVPPSVVRMGKNVLSISYERGAAATRSIKLVELIVRYG